MWTIEDESRFAKRKSLLLLMGGRIEILSERNRNLLGNSK
jgi:hypothetical protein